MATYVRLGGSRVRAQAQYRLSFVLQIFGSFCLASLDFIEILVIFHHLPRLGGWSLSEIGFIYGTSYISFRTADLVLGNLDKLPQFIRMGTLDQVLTRPLGTLGQVLMSDVDIRHIGAIAQGAVVLTYALQHLTIVWTAGRIVMLVVMIVSAVGIFAAIWIVTNAIAFWTTDAREVANAFTYGGNYFTQHPLNLFAAWMRRLMGYVVALAFVSYLPALYVLGKADPTGAPHALRFMSPLVAVAALAVAGIVWRTAIRHYRSTGS